MSLTLSGLIIILYAFKLFSQNIDQAADLSTRGKYTNDVWTFYPWMMAGIIVLGLGVISLLLATDDNSNDRTPTGESRDNLRVRESNERLSIDGVRQNSNRVQTRKGNNRNGSRN